MGRTLSRRALLTAVQSAGVVGAGGAGFPTHTKLACEADAIIANGAECEPLLEVDGELLIHYLEEVLTGLKAAQEVVGARYAYLAVKAKHRRLMEKLQAASGERPWLKPVGLPDVYPMGDEQVLVHEILGRVVPPGGLPIQVGAVVVNIETLLNIARALQEQSVITSYVTVNGAVAEPFTMAVPVGTAMEEVLALARPLLAPDDFAVIEGGPMMGSLLHDLQQPVTKTTKGLVVLPWDHAAVMRLRARTTALRRSFSVCSQCTMCTDLCPRHMLGHPLWPHRIMRALGREGRPRGEVLAGALLCSECGICDNYACFMGLSPRQVNQELKADFLANGSRKPYFTGPSQARNGWKDRQVPTFRLIHRLDLARWAKPAPLRDPCLAPASVELPLKQHVGVAARPVVQVGDIVNRGTMVGDVPEGVVGASVHSSIEGVVSSIDDRVVVIRRGGSNG